MHNFLVEQKVHYTSIDPVRIGIVNESAAPVIIWVGVEPGSLSAKRGLEVAVGLRAFLLENGIEDVHVEIRESVVTALAKMYKPAPTSNPTVQVREAFSTALGFTICAEKTPDIQGTATLFFSITSTADPVPAGTFCYGVRATRMASMLASRTLRRISGGPRLLLTI